MREEAERPTSPIWARLGDVFAYFAQPSVIMVLVGLAIVQYLLSFVPFLGGILSFGISASIFFRIIRSTAYGGRELDPPDFTNPWDDILSPALSYIAASLPMILALVWAGTRLAQVAVATGQANTSILEGLQGPMVLFLVGVVLFPLLLTAAGLGATFFEMFDPRRWVDTLRKMGADYVVGVLIFYGIFIVEQLVVLPWALTLYLTLDVAVLGPLVVLLVLIVPWAVRARLLGAICEPYTPRGPARPELPLASVVGGAPPGPLPEDPAFALTEAIRTGSELRAQTHASPIVERFAESDPARAIQLFGEASKRFPGLTFTDTALLAVARAGAQTGEPTVTVRAVQLLMQQHPDSPHLGSALWTTAIVQEQQGRRDLMAKTLRMLIEQRPNDRFAEQARRKLAE